MGAPTEYAVCVVECQHPATGRHVEVGVVGIVTGAAKRLCVDGWWWDRANWEAATVEEWRAFKDARLHPPKGEPPFERVPYVPGLVIVDGGVEVPVAGHEIVGGHAVPL